MKKIQDKAIHVKANNPIMALHGFNIFLLVINFMFNFLGHPGLKYVYLAQVIFILITILVFNFEDVFIEILILFFIEGQGRVIWEYQSWARIIFDITTLLSITKLFILKKKIFNRKLLPWPIIALIILHFFWYIIQIFNVYSVSILGVIAASKIYIFPIFLFLAILQANFDTGSKEFKLIVNFIIALLVAEMALNYYQVTMKQSHLLGISNYYYKAMSNGIFYNTLFRPFATMQLPGTLAVFLFLTVPFLYLKKFSAKGTVFKIIVMVFSCYSIILCQIRSALVKYLLIVAFIQLGLMIYERFKPKTVIPIILTILVLIFGGKMFFTENKSSGDIAIDHAKQRISALADVNKIKGERISLSTFGQIALEKISNYPLGFGPGMTGPAASLNKEEMAHNPLINRNLLWTSDNLIISLLIDLGVGSIFYILLVLFIPAYLARFLFTYYKLKNETRFRTLLAVTSTLVVILIGNWGAVGLTYNPESFIFWMLSALGFKTITDLKNGESHAT